MIPRISMDEAINSDLNAGPSRQVLQRVDPLSVDLGFFDYHPWSVRIGYGTSRDLLVDAGLAKGVDTTSVVSTSPSWRILHLTSAGHDFADAARDEGRWRKATGLVKDKAGGVTIDVMKELLISLIKSGLGL